MKRPTSSVLRARATFAGPFRWAAIRAAARCKALSVTPNGDVQVSGAFRGTGDFDPDPAAETWLTSSGTNQTVFTATLTQVAPDPGAPTVDAGQNQTILVTGSANLDGTVTDDGLPGPLTTTWSLQSGPGTVTFGNASAVDTTATFSTIGTYLLKLEATDGQFTTADYVHIVVNPLTATLTATADTYIDGGNTTTNYGASASLIVDGKPDDGGTSEMGLEQHSRRQHAAVGDAVDQRDRHERRHVRDLRIEAELDGIASHLEEGQLLRPIGNPPAHRVRWTAARPYWARSPRSATGIRNVVLNAAGLAVVQGWVNNPATNFGFILQDYANTTDDDLVFSSKEATVAANRPQLQVVYNPPSVAPLSLSAAAATASTTSTGDIFASKLVQTSTGGNVSVAKPVQTARWPRPRP